MGSSTTQMLTVADLFSGAGGISLGFAQANYEAVVAVDFDRWSCLTYEANFGDHSILSKIEDVGVCKSDGGFVWRSALKAVETPEIDVIVGGPPCQGFSPLGRMSDWNKKDPRNRLWREYFRILDTVRPRCFVIENVPQLLKSSEFSILAKRVAAIGYNIASGILNAEEFGVPQKRLRAIVVGTNAGIATLPLPTGKRRTVRDAIGDLPLEPTNLDLHLGRNPTSVSRERYACIPEGGNRFDLARARPDITPRCWKRKRSGSTDVFGRMWFDRAAPTIRTEFFKPEKGRYLHPVANRPITLREAARLQTFPDNFVFMGSNVQIAKQIGNAVPVELAHVIAMHLKQYYFASVAA